ncbi:MAG: hypothetical protein U0640_13770 [Phycisphaerales bacterium]
MDIHLTSTKVSGPNLPRPLTSPRSTTRARTPTVHQSFVRNLRVQKTTKPSARRVDRKTTFPKKALNHAFPPVVEQRRRERQDTVKKAAPHLAVFQPESRTFLKPWLRVSARGQVLGGERDKTDITCTMLEKLPEKWATFLEFFD